MRLIPLLAIGYLAALTPARQDPSESPRDVLDALAKSGIDLDLEQGTVSVPATFLILDDWLEYLIVTPQGKSHESLFQTEVRPSLLNAAILALGLEPGERMQWVDRDPPPTEEEMEAGVRPIVPVAPKGPELFLYAEWTSGDEVYRYRVEDLVLKSNSRTAMERTGWVFVSSPFVLDHPRPGQERREVFGADRDGNIASLCFFANETHLLSSPDPDAVHQTIWTANPFLCPAKDTPCTLIFSKKRLVAAWK